MSVGKAALKKAEWGLNPCCSGIGSVSRRISD